MNAIDWPQLAVEANYQSSTLKRTGNILKNSAENFSPTPTGSDCIHTTSTDVANGPLPELLVSLALALTPALTLPLPVPGCWACAAPAGPTCAAEVQSCQASGVPLTARGVPARRRRGWGGDRAPAMGAPCWTYGKIGTYGIESKPVIDVRKCNSPQSCLKMLHTSPVLVRPSPATPLSSNV